MREKEGDTLQEIGSGGGAKVYLVERPDGERLAKKIFEPNLAARAGYRALRWKEHPYRSDYAPYVIKGAYELRRIASRLAQAFNLGVEVVDAIELCKDELGFYSPFIEGASNYSPANKGVKESLDLLEAHFSRIGLPVWSFGGYLKEERRKTNVLIGENGTAFLVDYEAGWPYFSRQDIIGFDEVCVFKLRRFLELGSPALRVRLGEGEFLELMRSWEKYQLYSHFWRDKESALIRKAQSLRESLTWRSLNERIGLLLDQDEITPERAETMSLMLRRNKDLLDRVKPHILAHFLISLPLRFPFGSASRVIYTASMRAFDEVSRLINKGKREKIQIHDGKVAILTACPVWTPPFTFFAYLTKVLGEAPLSYLILDNIFFRLNGGGLEKEMVRFGSHKVAKALLRLKEGRNIGSEIFNRVSWGVERMMASLLSDEVIEKAGDSIRRGATTVNQEEKEILTKELISQLEEAIDTKYLAFHTL